MRWRSIAPSSLRLIVSTIWLAFVTVNMLAELPTSVLMALPPKPTRLLNPDAPPCENNIFEQNI